MNMLNVLPLGVVGTWEIVLIVLVVLLVFGGKKIPELMRGLGKGVSEFKKGKEEVEKMINEPVKPSVEAGKSEKVLEPDKIEKTDNIA